MKFTAVRSFLLLLPLAGVVHAVFAANGSDVAYAQVATERAEKIVGPLGITEAGKLRRVRDAIAQHYKNLRDIDDARDASMRTAKLAGDDQAAVTADRLNADLKRSATHRELLGRLYADLTLEQIEGVKNGLTYNVFPNTYRVYLEMLPDLSDEQRAQIKAWLAEAREYAMDGGSSDEKHKWFGKYKGRINNYLSAAGYDMKKAERDLAGRRKQAKAQK